MSLGHIDNFSFCALAPNLPNTAGSDLNSVCKMLLLFQNGDSFKITLYFTLQDTDGGYEYHDYFHSVANSPIFGQFKGI